MGCRENAPFDEEDEQDDDVLASRDDPDEADFDEGDDDCIETVPCPYCGRAVAEDAAICPHCRSFISFEDAAPRRPWWIWVGVILGLLGILWWVL